MEKIVTPESSNIEWFGYESKTSKLSVKFKNGKTFVYSSVPHDTFARMKGAESKGSFFAKNVKDKFDAVIEEDVL